MLPDTCYTVKSEWITLNYEFLNMEKARNYERRYLQTWQYTANPHAVSSYINCSDIRR